MARRQSFTPAHVRDVIVQVGHCISSGSKKYAHIKVLPSERFTLCIVTLQFPVMARHERNVVILGKVGTGKKTLGNHIVGKNIFNRSYHESAFATRNAKSYYAEFTTEHVVYRILTIDTESLQTSYNDPISHIKKEFGNIHLIVFVAAHGRYTDESHGSLIRVVQSLNQQAKSICALVVTGCHGMTDAQRLTVITEFKHDRRSSQVADFMGKEIYAAGFQDTSALPPEVQDVMQKGITRDEQAIRQLVDECEDRYSTQALPRGHGTVRFFGFRLCTIL